MIYVEDGDKMGVQPLIHTDFTDQGDLYHIHSLIPSFSFCLGLSQHTLSAAVSANITGILEALLLNYDKTERPSYQDGKVN